jgi:glycerol kinase
MSEFILAVDQGTTNTTAAILDAHARIVTLSDSFPLTAQRMGPEMIEYEPDELLASVRQAVRSVLKKSGIPARSIRGMGLANQGETVIAFDRATGAPVHRAISWMDRRNADLAKSLQDQRSRIVDSTGLFPHTYFSALKMRWLLDSVPGLRKRAETGLVCLATSDVWLLNRLIAEQPVATDPATASRTMLMNLKTLGWDNDLADLLEIPVVALPEIVQNDATLGHLHEDVCGAPVPVCGVCVDQQAALFGQNCFSRGDTKITYGTGCFVLTNVGDDHALRAGGLLTSVGWQIAGKPEYVLDGGIHNAGNLVEWLVHGAGLARSVSEIDAALGSASDRGGVFFIPALLGLAAPHWAPGATAAWLGLTTDTTREHLLASALEAVAFRVREVVDAVRSAGCVPGRVRADGGLTRSAELMQMQADLLGIPIDIFDQHEATAYGVGLMAGIGCGLWQPDDLPVAAVGTRQVVPDPDGGGRCEARYERWRALLQHHKEVTGYGSISH